MILITSGSESIMSEIFGVTLKFAMKKTMMSTKSFYILKYLLTKKILYGFLDAEVTTTYVTRFI